MKMLAEPTFVPTLGSMEETALHVNEFINFCEYASLGFGDPESVTAFVRTSHEALPETSLQHIGYFQAGFNGEKLL